MSFLTIRGQAIQCSLGQAAVHRYLQKAAAAGLRWPLPEDLDDRRLDELLFPVGPGRPSHTVRCLPDFGEIRRQLQTHKHLTCSRRRRNIEKRSRTVMATVAL